MPIHSTCNKPKISSFTTTTLLLDSPYIRMIKFHDVRLQNGLDLDPLWCHEGM